MSVAIAIDASGSCTEDFHDKKALARLKADFGGQQVRVIVFSDKILLDDMVDLNDATDETIQIRYGRSTMIDGVVKILKEEPVDHLVILTDGYYVSRDMSRCAGAITFLLYHEMDDATRDLLLKGTAHGNVFLEVLEKPVEESKAHVRKYGCDPRNLVEWINGNRATPFGPKGRKNGG